MSGSYIGPFTSVAQDCAITDSEIEYSDYVRTLLAGGCSATRTHGSPCWTS